MACGTPVIAIGRGSVPELIRHGETGLIVHSLDEAVQAVPLAVRLDRAAIHRYAAARFSADRMVDDYLRVYDTMLAQPAHNPHRMLPPT
jgi:glycosyltransferase involved in cell wall biosynthesis